MAVTVTRGEGGAATLNAVDLCLLSLAPRVDPPLYAPPLPGYDYPLNYAFGIYVPTAVVRTNPYKDFWTAAAFATWFGITTNTTRRGDLASPGSLLYYDGKYSGGQTGPVGAGFTIDIVQGMPVDLTMNFLSTGTVAAGTTAISRAGTVNQPAMSSNVTFPSLGANHGIHRCTIAFSNNCRPSGEISSSNWPAAITADAPSFTVTLLQKAQAVVPTTTMNLDIVAPGPSTARITMIFQRVTDYVETYAFGEQLIETTFQGMLADTGSKPFIMTWT